MAMSTLLTSLTEALTSASASLPSNLSFAPPAEGISLLDTKNELFLSYIQHLVFLILLKIRSRSASNESTHSKQDTQTQSSVIKKLVEHRIYLEKGVRPLESRLKYQIDKVLLAASNDTARQTTQPSAKSSTLRTSVSRSASPIPDPQIPDLTHRPNPLAFMRPSQSSQAPSRSTAMDGVYRPPRITPTTLPTTTSRAKPTRASKSHTIESFITSEMTDAPVAEASIGSRIRAGGREKGLGEKERRKEEDRKGYEESNLVRLPIEKKKRKRGGADEELGGGEWEGWGELGETTKGKGKKRVREGKLDVMSETWEGRRQMASGGRKRKR